MEKVILKSDVDFHLRAGAEGDLLGLLKVNGTDYAKVKFPCQTVPRVLTFDRLIFVDMLELDIDSGLRDLLGGV